MAAVTRALPKCQQKPQPLAEPTISVRNKWRHERLSCTCPRAARKKSLAQAGKIEMIDHESSRSITDQPAEPIHAVRNSSLFRPDLACQTVVGSPPLPEQQRISGWRGTHRCCAGMAAGKILSDHWPLKAGRAITLF